MSTLFCLTLMVPALPAEKTFTTERPFSKVGHDDWEPSVAADSAGHVYMATTRYGGPNACKGCPDPAIVVRRSSDGGRTWSKPDFICRCRGVEGQHDPVMVTDRHGRVFMTWMNDFDVQFGRSDDFGRTWSRPGSLDGALNFSDKPWIAASRSGRDVYVFFNASDPYAVYSHNAGRTWSEPILTTKSGLYFFLRWRHSHPGRHCIELSGRLPAGRRRSDLVVRRPFDRRRKDVGHGRYRSFAQTTSVSSRCRLQRRLLRGADDHGLRR